MGFRTHSAALHALNGEVQVEVRPDPSAFARRLAELVPETDASLARTAFTAAIGTMICPSPLLPGSLSEGAPVVRNVITLHLATMMVLHDLGGQGGHHWTLDVQSEITALRRLAFVDRFISYEPCIRRGAPVELAESRLFHDPEAGFYQAMPLAEAIRILVRPDITRILAMSEYELQKTGDASRTISRMGLDPAGHPLDLLDSLLQAPAPATPSSGFRIATHLLFRGRGLTGSDRQTLARGLDVFAARKLTGISIQAVGMISEGFRAFSPEPEDRPDGADLAMHVASSRFPPIRMM
jgi:hypothetical protein